MKKIFTLFAAVLLTANVLAQAPQTMSYQAVIRNSSNSLVVNTQVGMQISILQTTDSGTAVYVETQRPTTNTNGLVSLAIGSGTTTGHFSAIDWSAGPYFIKTETDPTGGTNYSITGTSQLMSVPYALYAANSGTVSGVTATMVGLGNVNNSSDVNKPVSSAGQTALDLKANIASPDLTGTPTAPTATSGNNTTQLATTAFVNTAVTGKFVDLTTAQTVAGAKTFNNAVAIGGTSSTSSAIVEVTSTTQGFLPPRMTNNQKIAINNPVAGLVVWCKNCGTNGELQVYNGSIWTNMIGANASSVPINLGDSYGGGTVIYLYQSSDNGYVVGEMHGIIVANDDAGYSPWGCNVTTTNATGIIFGAAALNTTNIITSNCGGTAAQLCVDYRGGGYSDWYLPSINELNIIFTNRAYLPSSLSQYLYWSSSETSSVNAYRKDMRNANTGSFQSFGKTSNSHVRAIRYF